MSLSTLDLSPMPSQLDLELVERKRLQSANAISMAGSIHSSVQQKMRLVGRQRGGIWGILHASARLSSTRLRWVTKRAREIASGKSMHGQG